MRQESINPSAVPKQRENRTRKNTAEIKESVTACVGVLSMMTLKRKAANQATRRTSGERGTAGQVLTEERDGVLKGRECSLSLERLIN